MGNSKIKTLSDRMKDYELVSDYRLTKRTPVIVRYENKEILDDTEKKYLADVIRPFRNRITKITKVDNNNRSTIYSNLL